MPDPTREPDARTNDEFVGDLVVRLGEDLTVRGTDMLGGAQIDVAGGLRPKFGNFSLNFCWVHYFYSLEEAPLDAMWNVRCWHKADELCEPS